MSITFIDRCSCGIATRDDDDRDFEEEEEDCIFFFSKKNAIEKKNHQTKSRHHAAVSTKSGSWKNRVPSTLPRRKRKPAVAQHGFRTSEQEPSAALEKKRLIRREAWKEHRKTRWTLIYGTSEAIRSHASSRKICTAVK
jgi:hypothetical protein